MNSIRKPAIAVIGIAGRYPDAPDVEAFWRNLQQGHESLTPLSEQELRDAGVPPELFSRPEYVRKATIIEGSDLFDAAFFGVSPREAEIIDPQQRVLLECAWEAMEDAGYGGGEPKDVGIFAGASLNSYVNNLYSDPDVIASAGIYQVIVGSDKDFLATRIAYKLDLRGPCITVQTACSTSLVSVHMACQALLANECSMALAGGVALRFPQKSGYLYQEGMIFSPDGHCRPFDAEGKGIRGGEGVGLVVLKRLDDAMRDGDAIRAVILGTAINNDGADKVGYTAPSVDGQAKVLASALKNAGVDPESVSYVEAHGTATPLGDPIEFAALCKAYGDSAKPCTLGAVKGNIGHLDIAAGIAGLTKTLLAFQHQQIPPTLHFKTPNPELPLMASRFRINTETVEWASGMTPRRAAVSSFGIGGANAHIVLEEAPLQLKSQVQWPEQLLVISASSANALETATRRLAAHLESHPQISLADLCYTSQVGRKRFSHRRAIVCSTVSQLKESLQRALSTDSAAATQESLDRPVAFMFTGQGSQYPGMARELYSFQPTFRRNLDLCAELLHRDLGYDFRELLYGAGGIGEFNETKVAQPVLFAVEYALASMWMSFGVIPQGMIGHSLGEFLAACLAGVFSLEDALRVVAIRGRIMQSMPRGSMLSVRLSEEELRTLVNHPVSVAAVNSPSLCTVSGPDEEIAALQRFLESLGIACSPLHTSHAFHSSMMESALAPLGAFLRTIQLNRPSAPFISNITGTWIHPDAAIDPDYWCRHLRQTVQFAAGVAELAAGNNALLLEVGPGQVLSSFVRECNGVGPGREVFSSLPHPKDPQSASKFLLNTLGKLWLAGVAIDWKGVHEGESLHRVPLPTYPFERRRYFIPAKLPQAVRAQLPPLAKKPDIADWFYAPSWKRTVSPAGITNGQANGPWLIFADSGGHADAFIRVLSGSGQPVTRVQAGASFSYLSECTYQIDPRSAQDYRELLGKLIRTGQAPRSLLFLWGLDYGKNSFHQLIRLAQAFGEHTYQEPVDWTIVSTGMQQVHGDERVDPEMALLLGPCKTIPLEYPNMRCRCVDLGDGHRIAEVARQLTAEFSLPAAFQVVAYRSGYRWEQIFEPVPLSTVGKEPIRPGGVYLITGGLGGIGLTLARYLAGFQARLGLISRTALPHREDWQRWLDAHSTDDGVSLSIQNIQELESLGAEVLPIGADVAIEDEMLRAVTHLRARFGPIEGIIHAAGIAGGGIIQIKTEPAAERVLSAKVNGTRILHALTKEDPLAFFVLCSSVNSVAGVTGAVDYTAANSYLDAFAAGTGGRDMCAITSINWDTWQEVGMAVNTKVPLEMREARRQALAAGIQPQEGVEAFRRILSSRLPQVAVVTKDLNRLIAASPAMPTVPGPETTELVNGQAPAAHLRPDLSTAFEPPQNEVQRIVADTWKDALGLREVGLDDNFFELGGHSLTATGILARIRTAFGISLPLRVVFESPTVRLLSEHVETLRWNVLQIAPSMEDLEREEVEI